MRVWCAREFAEYGIDFTPVQANMGFSARKGTVRGMHLREAPALEAKLVRCTRGAIFDVVLDLRTGSPSYGKWYGAELSTINGRMLYVPEHCAHGYQTLEEDTEMYYMTSGLYAPTAVRGVTACRLALLKRRIDYHECVRYSNRGQLRSCSETTLAARGH